VKQLVQTSIEDNYDTHVVYTKRPNFPAIPLGSLGSFISGLRNNIRRLRKTKTNQPLGRTSLSDLKLFARAFPQTFAMLVTLAFCSVL